MISLPPPRPATGGCCDRLPTFGGLDVGRGETATTPLIASAALVSIDLMSAQACGERTKQA